MKRCNVIIAISLIFIIGMKIYGVFYAIKFREKLVSGNKVTYYPELNSIRHEDFVDTIRLKLSKTDQGLVRFHSDNQIFWSKHISYKK